MKATGWSSGTTMASGEGYGLRISHRDRDAYFDPEWLSVALRVGGRSLVVDICPSFWRRCTELRSAELGRYFLGKGLAPWPKGEPPVFELVPEGRATFRLEPI